MSFGVEFYRGPSMLNGHPIVGIVTGLEGESNNPKTGKMAQAYILRSDQHPVDAVRHNTDDAICGDCKLRGSADDGWIDRRCYVSPLFGPHMIFKAFQDGAYPAVSWPELQACLEGRAVRLGAYGDPAAIPFETWQALLVTVSTWTGYSHAWRYCDPRFKSILMASVDTEHEFVEARFAGWRTFRILMPDDAPIPGHEFRCPASDEMGHRVTCSECSLCRGTASPARSVAIHAHGKPTSLKAWGIRPAKWFGRREQETLV